MQVNNNKMTTKEEMETLQLSLFRFQIPVELRSIIIKDYYLSWPISELHAFSLAIFKHHIESWKLRRMVYNCRCHYNFVTSHKLAGTQKLVLELIADIFCDPRGIHYKLGKKEFFFCMARTNSQKEDYISLCVVENIDKLTEEKMKELHQIILDKFRNAIISLIVNECI